MGSSVGRADYIAARSRPRLTWANWSPLTSTSRPQRACISSTAAIGVVARSAVKCSDECMLCPPVVCVEPLCIINDRIGNRRPVPIHQRAGRRYYVRMSTPTSKALLTRQEAADRLRISLTKMSGLITAGEIYVVRMDRKVLVPEESLDAFVRGERPYSRPEDQPNADTWPPTPSIFTNGQAAGDGTA